MKHANSLYLLLVQDSCRTIITWTMSNGRLIKKNLFSPAKAVQHIVLSSFHYADLPYIIQRFLSKQSNVSPSPSSSLYIIKPNHPLHHHRPLKTLELIAYHLQISTQPWPLSPLLKLGRSSTAVAIPPSRFVSSLTRDAYFELRGNEIVILETMISHPSCLYDS